MKPNLRVKSDFRLTTQLKLNIAFLFNVDATMTSCKAAKDTTGLSIEYFYFVLI